jgi:hypothetical protein
MELSTVNTTLERLLASSGPPKLAAFEKSWVNAPKLIESTPSVEPCCTEPETDGAL